MFLLIIIWSLFFLIDYFILKFIFKKEFHDSTYSWSQGDRMIGIFISLFGPIAFLIGLICIILLTIENYMDLNNKKANW